MHVYLTTKDLLPSGFDLPASQIRFYHVRRLTIMEQAETVILNHNGEIVCLKSRNVMMPKLTSETADKLNDIFMIRSDAERYEEFLARILQIVEQPK